MGPVQVLVVGFDPPAFNGEVLAELGKLREAGIVRLVDLLLVEHADDGTLQTLAAPGSEGLGLGKLATAVLAGDPEPNGGGDSPDALTWSLADAVPPGSVAAVALIEHLWAGPLTDAIRRTGGTALEETWLAPPERAALEALESQRL